MPHTSYAPAFPTHTRKKNDLPRWFSLKGMIQYTIYIGGVAIVETSMQQRHETSTQRTQGQRTADYALFCLAINVN